jgi:predicted O-linked N-acetylglucosamine transferase (SPINDLY family)
LNHQDRTHFEVHLFADCSTTDLPGNRLQEGDRVHAIEALDTADAARCIDEAALDVLVDLNAYSAPRRLPLYLGRRAPRVVAWFNMYATSGLPGIDVIVGDQSVVLPGEEVWFSERVERLQLSYLAFIPDSAAPPVVASPCTHAPFSFGSLSSQYKLNDAVVDTWSRILTRAPGSRLLLGNADLRSPCNREHLLARFAERGVDAGRLTWLPPAAHAAFLRHYDLIDLALDPFPYAGGTTTTEALWQGVPVLTLRGDRWAARTSASLLDSAGLARFACQDVERYVDAAVRLATDASARAELADLRPRMREQLRASRVCDCASLARGMERVYVGG